MEPLARLTAQLVKPLADLVWPALCAGCGEPGRALCVKCQLAFAGPVRRCEQAAVRLDFMGTAPELPVWTTTAYADVAAEVIMSAKNRGQWRVVTHLADVVEQVGFQVAPALRGLGLLTVVPLPSRVRPAHQRMLTATLAAGVARGLRAGGCAARVECALATGTRHQVGRNVRGRGRRQVFVDRVLSGPVVLVDDVLTTGATMAAAARALSEGGAVAVGAIVLAATVAPALPGDAW